MDPSDKQELEALVVGFLTQSLRDNPDGFSIQEFERFFPERTDEPVDWYKRYKKRTTLDALECINDVVTVDYNQRRHCTLIRLNKRSNKVDTHLVDLITNQRASNKKRRGNSRPSSRALSSFSLNSSGFYNRNNSFKSRINYDQQYRGENSFIKRDTVQATSFRPSIYTKYSPASRMVAGDPRNRGPTASMVPPQIRSTNQASTPRPRESTQPRPSPVAAPPKPAVKPVITESSQPNEQDNPALLQKKNHLRQRIVSLLTRKIPEIKLLHLRSLYKLEYDEDIIPSDFGYENFTNLLQDPQLSEHIQINYTSGFVTISVRDKIRANGKENVASNDYTKRTDTNQSNGFSRGTSNSNQPPAIPSAKAKLNAIDPFNVKTMLQTLEPIGLVKEPPLKNLEIDEEVKYKTMRMIFKAPETTLKLDEWEGLFMTETRCKIRIREYGFKTVLEFFRKLEKELPLKIESKNGQWVAIADIEKLSSWVQEKLTNGHYKAVTAIDSIYELVALPNDTYTFSQNFDELKDLDFVPAYVLGARPLGDKVKLNSCLWVQLRTPKRIEDHLCVEASMTCYQDYHDKNLLRVPGSFIKEGFPCAVFDKIHQRWCRALITDVPPKVDKNYDVKALLVDYGTTRKYPVSQILCLMKTHFKFPVGAIYSRLSGVKNDSESSVKQRFKVTLHEYTNPPITLACKFINAVPTEDPGYLPKSCFEITLVDTRYGDDCNLADFINLPQDQNSPAIPAMDR